MLNDVFFRCAFERDDEQAQRGRDLLVAHASGCRFFDGKEFLCGQDPSRCENAYKYLGFESNVAVVY